MFKEVRMRVGVFCCGVVLTCASVTYGQSQAFQRYLHDDGSGANFDQAILLHDLGDYSSCDTWECAENVFNGSVLQGEMMYVAQYFGKPDVDWTVSGHKEVTAYLSADSRYYDNLDIRMSAAGENKALIFDITSCVDALKNKESAIDPDAAAAKWAPDPIWPIYD